MQRKGEWKSLEKEQAIKILKFCRDIYKEIEFNKEISLTGENGKLYALKNEIIRELNALPYREKNILFLFYIKGESWKRISRTMQYSVRQCRNIRTVALQAIAARFTQNQLVKGFTYPE